MVLLKRPLLCSFLVIHRLRPHLALGEVHGLPGVIEAQEQLHRGVRVGQVVTAPLARQHARAVVAAGVAVVLSALREKFKHKGTASPAGLHRQPCSMQSTPPVAMYQCIAGCKSSMPLRRL